MNTAVPKAISQSFKMSSSGQSISTILADLNSDELERVAIDIIREHRRLIQHAEDLYERLTALDEFYRETHGFADLHHAYRLALIGMMGHHQVAAAVIEMIGYVPPLPEDENLHHRQN